MQEQVAVGRVFNKLTVIEFHDRNGRRNGKRYLCRCECGTEKVVATEHLIGSYVKSCGCLNRKPPPNKTHGKKNHPLYGTWQNMKNRCYNKNVMSYANYGARGITICDEWLHDFQAFYDWAMENGWKPTLEIDRTNNDGGYSPGNCRIVTRKINLRNKGLYKNNKTGYRGVRPHGWRFTAYHSRNGTPVYLGLFSSPEEASAVVEKANASITAKLQSDTAQ